MKPIDLNLGMSNRDYPNACVHPNTKIGANVQIGPHSIIGENVIIGDSCMIESNVIIEGWTTIGSANKFYTGSSIGCDSQDVTPNKEKNFLNIGDNNTFREYVSISIGTAKGGGETRIGNNNLFMNYSHIAHDCQIGNHVIITNSVNLAGNVRVEDQARIGGLSNIGQFCRIGKMAMVGAMSQVEKDIPPYLLVDGNPIGIYGINTVGLRRNEVDSEAQMALKRAHHLLYRSNLKLEDAIERMEQELIDIWEVKDFISFLRESKIGVLGL
jgi:UDP-N-acetylglucosamine acyltransferase